MRVTNKFATQRGEPRTCINKYPDTRPEPCVVIAIYVFVRLTTILCYGRVSFTSCKFLLGTFIVVII